jgi:hypothetical protein
MAPKRAPRRKRRGIQSTRPAIDYIGTGQNLRQVRFKRETKRVSELANFFGDEINKKGAQEASISHFGRAGQAEDSGEGADRGLRREQFC